MDNLLVEKEKMLEIEYSKYDNFFPVTTLDLKEKGIKDNIHIMYVSFDPSIDEKPFPKNDDIDEFSFRILANGLYRPTFDESALKIGNDFRSSFKEGQEKYLRSIKTQKIVLLVKQTKKPRWWQYDQTPLNSKGQKMKFICQMHVDTIFNDDCELYVFYDESDRLVKYIYQRD